MLENCTPSFKGSLFGLDFKAMYTQIMWQENTPFESCGHTLSLLFSIKWELRIREVKIIKFYWSKNERTLYFSFQSSLETSWVEQIEVLFLGSLIRFRIIFDWLVVSFSLTFLGLGLSFFGCLDSLEFFVLKTLFKGITSVIELFLLIGIFSETSSINFSKLSTDIFMVFSLENIFETLKHPFISRIMCLEI